MAVKFKTKRDYSCGGVVLDEDGQRILLVRVINLKKEKVWTFPKGHPEGQERDEQAALREVMEETGWTCEVVNPLMDVHYSYVRDQTKFNKTVRWFLMRPLSDAGTFNTNEIIECKWVPIDEAKKYIVYESDVKLLKRVSLLI